MRNSLQLHYTLAFNGSSSDERIGRRDQAPALLRDDPLRDGAACPSRAPSRSAIDAYALRAMAANGFGDAALSRTGPCADLCSTAINTAARVPRSRRPVQLLVATWRAASARLRRWAADWRRRSLERDTCAALRELDNHTLRDLGFHRSEVRSLEQGVSGTADSSLTRAVQSLRGLC